MRFFITTAKVILTRCFFHAWLFFSLWRRPGSRRLRCLIVFQVLQRFPMLDPSPVKKNQKIPWTSILTPPWHFGYRAWQCSDTHSNQRTPSTFRKNIPWPRNLRGMVNFGEFMNVLNHAEKEEGITACTLLNTPYSLLFTNLQGRVVRDCNASRSYPPVHGGKIWRWKNQEESVHCICSKLGHQSNP